MRMNATQENRVHFTPQFYSKQKPAISISIGLVVWSNLSRLVVSRSIAASCLATLVALCTSLLLSSLWLPPYPKPV